MANPSLQIGSGNWAIKADELLGYRVVGNKYFPVPIDVSRATAATRVDEAGLVDYAEILGGEEVTNGDFTDTGSDLIVNGIFDTTIPMNTAGSGWFTSTTALFYNVGGVDGMKVPRTTSNAYGVALKADNSDLLTANTSYKISYEVLENNGSNGVYILAGAGTAVNGAITTGVTHTIYITSGATTYLRFYNQTNNSDYTITNVTCEELGADWAVIDGGGSVTFGDSFAEIIKTSAIPTFIQQDYPVTLGASHKLTYTVTENTLPSTTDELALSSASAYGYSPLDASASATPKTVYLTVTDITPNAALRLFSRGASGSIKITDISVKEVTRDNIARIDYTDGSSPHLLSEPQRENLITYSEPTTNEGAAANITYESFSWNIGFENCVAFGDNSVIRYRYGGSVTDGTEYTLSAYVLMDDNSEPVITNSSVSGDFSLNIGNTVATGTNNANVSMGNNIWRVSKTAVVAQTTTNNGIIKYTTQSSTGFKVVGWQLEAGSYATSYIPTSGSAVTRNKDQFTRDGIGGLINDSEGVLFVEMAALSNDLTYRILSLSDGTDNERIYIQYTDTTNQVSVVVKVGGSTQANIQHTLTDETVFSKMAFKWKANDFAFWIDGVEVGADTSGSVPSGLNRLALDRQLNTNTFYGKVKQLQVYPTALSDSELTILTTP